MLGRWFAAENCTAGNKNGSAVVHRMETERAILRETAEKRRETEGDREGHRDRERERERERENDQERDSGSDR